VSTAVNQRQRCGHPKVEDDGVGGEAEALGFGSMAQSKEATMAGTVDTSGRQ
jgi:hypothetical protein